MSLVVDGEVVWPLTITILLNGLLFEFLLPPLLKGCFQVFDFGSLVQNLLGLVWVLTALKLTDCSLSLMLVIAEEILHPVDY